MSMKCIGQYSFDITKKPLGKGAFGTVYKGIDTITGADVAVKCIPTNIMNNSEYSDLLKREIEILQKISGDNIVRMLDMKQTMNNMYIIMEFCNGGDLEKYLHTHKKMSEEEVLDIAYQFCKAFNTINNLDIRDQKGRKAVIMHRDLKTANILFHDGMIKIADFGFAKLVDEGLKDRKTRHTILGTPYYMAPQILNEDSYTAKCDIWSAGVLLYECLFGVLPWEGSSMVLLEKNIRTKPLKFPSEIGANTKDLLSKMLKIHEADRISWIEMKNHPAMKAIDALYNPPIPEKKSIVEEPKKIVVEQKKIEQKNIGADESNKIIVEDIGLQEDMMKPSMKRGPDYVRDENQEFLSKSQYHELL